MTKKTLSSGHDRRKKSGFYHARQKVGLNEDRAAEVLQVSREQVVEWDKAGNDLAERFLYLWDSKRISEPGWEGFCFTRGKLKYKNRWWTPQTLLKAHDDFVRSFSPSVIDTTTVFRGRGSV